MTSVRALAATMLLIGSSCEAPEPAARAPGVRRDANCTPGMFGTPVNVAAVNSGWTEWAADLSSDGLTLYFASDRDGGTGGFDIYQATRPGLDQPFSNVIEVKELNTAADEYGPALSHDGLTMYWATTTGGADLDIVYATRPDVAAAFGLRQVVPGINSSANEDTPALTADGLQLEFRSERTGNSDVYLATRPGLDAGWAVRPLREVNSMSASDEGAFLSSDGLTLIFASNRAGLYDLYMATRGQDDGGFDMLQRVDALNSPQNDNDADLSEDGLTVFFSSDRPGTQGPQDIWMATRSCAALPDAGTPDGGAPDAGTPDAGTPDAGTSDAGTPDAGPVAEPRTLEVGCGCHLGGPHALLLLAGCSLRRRPSRRASPGSAHASDARR